MTATCRRVPALATLVLSLCCLPIAHAFDPEHVHYISGSAIWEEQDDVDFDGFKLAYVAWWDDHAPGLFWSGGLEYVQAESDGFIARVTGSFSPIIAGSGRVGFALKPIIGFDYNDYDASDWGALAGAGIEVGIRPSQRSQIAFEYNYFKSFGAETSQQFLLGFRWSFW